MDIPMHGEEQGEGLDPQLPEEVLTWIAAGLPSPSPRAVVIWLDESPAHRALFEEYLEIWEYTAAPAPPPGLWGRVRLAIDEGESVQGESLHLSRVSWWRRPLAAAALVVLGLIPGLLWPKLQEARRSPMEAIHLEAPVGALASATLPGGIAVRLNADSRLSFQQRAGVVEEVSLAGEAHFTVPHNPERSFRVQTDAGVIHDIGTEFNVRARDEVVSVVVAEGEVELEAAGVIVRVQAGEESAARRGRAPEPARVADLAVAMAWLEGGAVFRNERLATIAAELERRYGVPFIVDSSLQQRQVTATIRGNSAEAAAQVICSVIKGRCQPAGDGWVIGK